MTKKLRIRKGETFYILTEIKLFDLPIDLDDYSIEWDIHDGSSRTSVLTYGTDTGEVLQSNLLPEFFLFHLTADQTDTIVPTYRYYNVYLINEENDYKGLIFSGEIVNA